MGTILASLTLKLTFSTKVYSVLYGENIVYFLFPVLDIILMATR